MGDLAVEMKGITKYFGDFCALDSVDLKVQKGTIHALLGENGAGKSTLMNILYGFYQSDGGKIFIGGEEKQIKTPSVAIELGIGMVHQHFMLVETFTVAENIMLGMETCSLPGILDMDKIRSDIVDLSERYGLFVDPDAKISDISVGMQQRVEILKTLYRGANILILDEPTAVLTPQEINELVNIMHNLTEDGKTVIIITHKLNEIKISSGFCTIIRRGKYIDTVKVSDVTEEQLASMMVGRDVNLHIQKEKANPKEVAFEIDNLTVADERGIDRVKNFSLKIRRGEIVGLAGIDGNGQKELVEAITCLKKAKTGTIKVNGIEIQNSSTRNVLENKVCTIHEDRHRRGLVLEFSVKENLVLENYRKAPFSEKGILNLPVIQKFASDLIERFDIRPSGCEDSAARSLSGGNQQKVIISREITNDPDVLIAAQPTRGLDVGAIEYVHKELVAQRDAGRAVLLISFELDEIMDVADTIAVIYEGSIVGIMPQEEANEEKIGLLMAGGGKKNGKN